MCEWILELFAGVHLSVRATDKIGGRWPESWVVLVICVYSWLDELVHTEFAGTPATCCVCRVTVGIYLIKAQIINPGSVPLLAAELQCSVESGIDPGLF